MAAEERRPLSLNECLELSLLRNRTTSHHTTEIRTDKVKLEGRRRLCKLSSRTDVGNSGSISPSGSSPGEKSDVNQADSICDVLDDLSSRLETLSVEKPYHNSLSAPQESEAEFESAASSLSSSSSEEKWREGIEKFKGEALRTLVLEQDEATNIKGVNGNAQE